MEHDDGFTVSTHELALSSQMNFDTLARMAPAFAGHPIFRLAMRQLAAVIARIEKDPAR